MGRASVVIWLNLAALAAYRHRYRKQRVARAEKMPPDIYLNNDCRLGDIWVSFRAELATLLVCLNYPVLSDYFCRSEPAEAVGLDDFCSRGGSVAAYLISYGSARDRGGRTANALPANRHLTGVGRIDGQAA